MSPKTEDYGWTVSKPHTDEYVTPVIMKLLRNTDAQTILDVGCGNGTLASELAKSGYTVAGIDGDRVGIAIAREQYPEIAFSVSLFDEPPPGNFDVVCATEVIEHLYSPHELSDYCFKALRPGGILLISTPYHGYLKNLALSIFGAWDKHFSVLWHGGHIKFWSRATLTELLTQSGFEVTHFAGAGRIPLLWKSMILLARRPIIQPNSR